MGTITDLLQSGRTLSSPGDVKSHLARMAEGFGCDAAWLSFTSGLNQRVRNTSRPRVAFAFNIDERERQGWLSSPEMDAEGALRSYAHDPIRRVTCGRNSPFFWEFLPRFSVDQREIRCTDEEERWIELKRKLGVLSGLTIPVHLYNGCQGSLTMIRDQRKYTGSRKVDDNIGEMFFEAHLLFEAWMQNLNWAPRQAEQDASLTNREKECLYWAARGKTASETAQILGISLGTCRKYLQVSLEKLGVQSKAAAIAKLSMDGADWL